MASAAAGSQPTNFTTEEKQLYARLFKLADTQHADMISGEDAFALFPKANLSQTQLGEIWAFADPDNRGFLLQRDFAKAMRMIGNLQVRPGREVTADLILEPCPPGFPKFEGINTGPGALFNANSGMSAAQAQRASIVPPNLQPQTSGSARIPPLTPDKVAAYTRLFETEGLGAKGVIDGDKATNLFRKSGLPNNVLAEVWNLADTEQRAALSLSEFIIAMHLLASIRSGSVTTLPQSLPPGLIEAASRRPTQGALPRQLSGANGARTSSPLARSAFTAPAQQQPSSDWLITPELKAQYDRSFDQCDQQRNGFISGPEAVKWFSQSGLPQDQLAQIWELSCIRGLEQLNRDEFAVAMFLIQGLRRNPNTVLPDALSPNLVPPALRGHVGAAFQSPQQTGFGLQQVKPQVPASATEDLFGLDALASSPPTGVQQQTTGNSSRAVDDPFGNKTSSPTQALPASPRAGGPTSVFKPFIPSSSFGQGLTTQGTGGSASSSTAQIKSRAQPSNVDDLLGDNDDSSRAMSNDTSDLANMSNQIGILRNQMQDLQGKRGTAESELTGSANEKRDLEAKLAQFRAHYEQEAQAVRTLEEQLAASRKETRRIQQDLAVLEAGYQDLQSQHQTVAAELENERSQNSSLQERMRQVNAEVAQLKPALEKMRNDTRHERGKGSIAKKQLEKAETDRNAMKTEIDELTRSPADASQTPQPDPPAAVSPAASTSSTNPFLRRSPQHSFDNTMKPSGFSAQQNASKGPGDTSDVFGPNFVSPAVASTPPATSFRAEPVPPQSGTSLTSSSGSDALTPSASPQQSDAPAPPISRQITSSDLPLRAGPPETAASSVRVETPVSRIAGGELPTSNGSASSPPTRPEHARRDTTTSTGAAMFDRAVSPSTSDKGKQTAKDDFFGSLGQSVPGAFPDTQSPMYPQDTGDSTVRERGKQAKPEGSKDEFDTAFASAGKSNTVTRQVSGSSSGDAGGVPKNKFNSEFPPIEAVGQESDSEDDEDGFGDDFTATSPPKGASLAAQQSINPPKPDASKSPDLHKAATDTLAEAQGSQSAPEGFVGALPSRENPLSPSSQEAQPHLGAGTKGDALFGGSSNASKSVAGAPGSGLSAFSGSPPLTSGTPASTTGTHSDAFHSAPTHPNTERGSASTQKSSGGFKDDFDAGFDDLAEDKGDDAVDDDLLFGNVHRDEGVDDWNPNFDSPTASKTGTLQSERTPTASQHPHGGFSDFDSFDADFKPFPGQTASGSSSKPISDDWDDMFKNIGGPSINNGASGKGHLGAFGENDLFDSTHSVMPAAPTPPPAAPEAPMPPKLGRSVTQSSLQDVEDVKRLVGMGIPRPLVVRALEKYDYDFDKALEHLTANHG